MRVMPDDLHVPTPPVEGAAPAQWRVRWATTGSEDVCAVAAVMIDGHPRAVTGSGGGLVRVWDLTTGSPSVNP